MYPIIHFLGYEIATYGLLISIGLCLGILVSLYLGKKRGYSLEDIFFTYLYGIIGLVVGGKLFYLLINFSSLWENRNVIFSDPKVIMNILSGGFVFYGGLIGGFAFAYLYSKQFKVSFNALLEVIVPSIPLIHAVGRLGCFSAGCCYGIHYEGPFSVIFHHSPIAPLGISLFPIQLFESFLNLMIFIVLFTFAKKLKSAHFLAGLYLILYSISRFHLEYLRGDIERGFQWLLSTSQWISLILCALGVYLMVIDRKNRKKQLVKHNI